MAPGFSQNFRLRSGYLVALLDSKVAGLKSRRLPHADTAGVTNDAAKQNAA
jgi:hypothetical protein